MKTIVYLTVNKVNRKIYVGIHDTEDPNIFDGYLGNAVNIYKPSSIKYPKTPFQYAVKKYGFDSFFRITLFECDTREEAQEIERFIVNEKFIGRVDTYNVTLGGDVPPVLNKVIYQYSLSGNYLRSFKSIKEASDTVGICECSIGRAVLDKTQSGNFYWSEVKEDKLDLNTFFKTAKKPVYVYYSNGVFKEEFNSITDAAKALDLDYEYTRRIIKSGTKVSGYYLSHTKYEIYPISKKEHNHSTIYQYNLHGYYIQEFKNSTEAAKECGFSINRLSEAIRLNKPYGDFFWSWVKAERIYVPTVKSTKRKVGRFDSEGNLLETFDTVRECRKQYPNVSKVLKGIAEHCHGFKFKYIDEDKE